MIERLKSWAHKLKMETTVLVLASQDPRTPWYAKALVLAVVAYAFSPLDLIPDFIPVLGALDDLILIPLGLALAIRFIPPEALQEARERARGQRFEGSSLGRTGIWIVAGTWMIGLVLAGWIVLWAVLRTRG